MNILIFYNLKNTLVCEKGIKSNFYCKLRDFVYLEIDKRKYMNRHDKMYTYKVCLLKNDANWITYHYSCFINFILVTFNALVICINALCIIAPKHEGSLFPWLFSGVYCLFLTHQLIYILFFWILRIFLEKCKSSNVPVQFFTFHISSSSKS